VAAWMILPEHVLNLGGINIHIAGCAGRDE
jgi:hypothetical protein